MALKTIEQFRTDAAAEVEAGKPYHKTKDGVRSELDKSDYDQLIEDMANSKFEKQNNSYKWDREDAYPSWREQLDLLFHDFTSGKGDKTGEWYKAIKKIKDDNPKPS